MQEYFKAIEDTRHQSCSIVQFEPHGVNFSEKTARIKHLPKQAHLWYTPPRQLGIYTV